MALRMRAKTSPRRMGRAQRNPSLVLGCSDGFRVSAIASTHPTTTGFG